ncbi:hypothetical protein FDG2_5106 [Candidatus Protofrankia californiensis]|uniref:Uncharacterized protein n=1 Tax=Candidatus Protofrankia californiensis TaxID=1839754 RepID=A0A1C3PAY7_9ACTN|nr:hypothetical protein FDG2_5106 [Candidatus Protofrankia californiensis]
MRGHVPSDTKTKCVSPNRVTPREFSSMEPLIVQLFEPLVDTDHPYALLEL